MMSSSTTLTPLMDSKNYSPQHAKSRKIASFWYLVRQGTATKANDQ